MSTRVTDLARLGAGEVDGADLMYVVDVSAGPAGSKRVSVADLFGRRLDLLAARLARSDLERSLLLAALWGGPDEASVYADYLEEQGEAGRAAGLRDRAADEGGR